MNQNYNNQQHILILSNGYPSVYQTLSGSFWKNQAEALNDQNCKVGLIATTPISLKDIKRKGVMNLRSKTKIENGVYTSVLRFPNIPFINFLESFFSVFFGFYLFKKYIRKNGLPDIIHVHRYEAGLLAIKIKNRYKIPYVVTEHSSRFLYETMSKKEISIARKVFLSAALCLAVSKALADKLNKTYGVNFQYFPNIVDTSFFKKRKEFTKNALFSFFSAGALDVNKNHKMLIDAFYLFHQQHPNSLLCIAGEGPLKSSLTSQIQKLGLVDSIELLGKLDRERMVEYNNKSHVFVLPSFKETFGVVLIEAMSSGLPVIALDSGGPASIVTDARLGEICDVNSDALSNAMNKVYTKFDTYSSDYIINYVNENFSRDKVILKLIKIYDQIINDNDRK